MENKKYVRLGMIPKLSGMIIDEIENKQINLTEIQKALLLIKEVETKKFFILKVIRSIHIMLRERKKYKLSNLVKALSFIRKLQKDKFTLKDIQIALFYVFNNVKEKSNG